MCWPYAVAEKLKSNSKTNVFIAYANLDTVNKKKDPHNGGLRLFLTKV
jgi:hypothetical protein